VNHRRPWWLVFSLLPPLIALCGLLIPFGCGGGGSSTATATPTPGEVSVAFVGVPPQGNFQKVLLNVAGIRINKMPNAQTNSPGWTTIAVPTSAGTGNAQNPGDLQIDLEQAQNGAMIFNNAGVEQGMYQTVQVLIDQTNVGTVIPACQSGAANTEGCINYPITTENALVGILLDLQTPLNISAFSTEPIVIQLQASLVASPANVGDDYVLDISANEVNAGSYLGSVSGTVTVTGQATQFHTSPLSVSAELTGTDTVVATVPVGKKNSYTLELPAALSGTTYDLLIGGAAVQYRTVQGVTLVPGQAILGMDFKSIQSNPGKFTGFIADSCTGLGIPGAEVDLLAPNQATPQPTNTPPASFCVENPDQCVVVAVSSADQNGSYPLGGTAKNPNGLDEVPVNQENLALRISASGYTTQISSAFVHPLSKDEQCSTSTSTTACSFSLTTGYLSGNVQLVTDPPPSSSTLVQVFAENSGTNQMVAALPQPLVFTHGETSQLFKMNVPLNPAVPTLDLFAVAIDPFQGGTDPFPGHDIPVLANQLSPVTGCQNNTIPAFTPMNCVGHGSISGSVANPDLGTSVEVEKLDPSMLPVQILGTGPGFFSSNVPGVGGNTNYALCVPPDDYQLQRFEVPSQMVGAPSATPTPVGSPQSIMVPVPAATSSPCPSTCSSNDTGIGPCPGICQNTPAGPL
jgi:hypothetical protein